MIMTTSVQQLQNFCNSPQDYGNELFQWNEHSAWRESRNCSQSAEFQLISYSLLYSALIKSCSECKVWILSRQLLAKIVKVSVF